MFPYDYVRCGLKPVTTVPSFKAEDYIDFGALAAPAYFLPSFHGYWGMLGNDSVSDCVQAMACHVTKEWKSRNGQLVPFKPENAIEAYSESAGYNGTWFSDQGTDIAAFFEYWRKTGIPDANSVRHKIGAYAVLSDPTDIAAVRKVIPEYYAVALGYNLARDAETQYERGLPWTETGVGDGATHCIPAVGWNSRNNLLTVTWPRIPGQLQAITPPYHEARAVIAIVAFSEEMLNGNGETPAHFDRARLLADISALNTRRTT